MNENLNLVAVRQLLNRSLGQLDQPTLASLRQAREQALLLHVPENTPPRWYAPARRHPAATWVAAVLLVVGLLGSMTYYWQQTHDSSDDIDLAILTDDTPIDVYVN